MFKKASFLIIFILCLGCVVDIGKHIIIKRQLLTLISYNPQAVQYHSFSLKILPFKTYLKIDNLKTLSEGAVESLTIRQPFFDFHKLSFTGENITFKNFIKASHLKVKFILQPGIYQVRNFVDAYLECRHFILKDFSLQVPNLTLLSPRVDSPWIYNLKDKTFKIALKPTVFTLNGGTPLSLNGKGELHMVETYPEGSLLLNVKGIQNIIDSFKNNGTLSDFQAQLFALGTKLMSNEFSEVPLNLCIHNKQVFFGNLFLFALP